jgi:predicted MFS family arabinose efflux permease
MAKQRRRFELMMQGRAGAAGIRTGYGTWLLAASMLFWFSLYAYSSVFTPYLADVKVSLAMSGVILGSYGLTQTILRIPLGVLSDRLRNKKGFIIAAMVLALVSGAGLYIWRAAWLILVFRGLAGVAAAAWVHFTTLYMSYYPANRLAPALGRINFTTNLAQMTAMLTGSYLAEYFGWSAAFLAAAIAAVPGLLLACGLYEARPARDLAGRPPGFREILQLGRDRLLFWTSILTLLSQLVVFATIQGFVPEYASQLGASKSALGYLLLFAMLPRAVAALLGGSVLARWFRLRSLIVLSLALLGVATLILPSIHSLPLLFLDQFLAGFGIGVQYTLLMTLATQTVSLDRRTSAMSFFQAVYGVGMVAGPVLVGLLAQLSSLGAGFFVMGSISLLAALLAALVL